MPPILQSRLPHAPWMDPRTARLPGVLPHDGQDWLAVDDAYGAQMALRDQLIADQPLLTGACLCFPSSWSLSEKLGRALGSIHRTVADYEPDLARRVQRMFDLIRPDRPLWRMNALVYVNPDLHQPGSETAGRTDRRSGQFLRAERQSFVRLPTTGAVLFAIHTYVVRLDSLTEAERAGLESARL